MLTKVDDGVLPSIRVLLIGNITFGRRYLRMGGDQYLSSEEIDVACVLFGGCVYSAVFHIYV